MKYVQILSGCNSDIGSCCSDGTLVSLIDITRKVMEIFQVIVPIVLLVMLTVQLTKLVINPDEKGGLKKITNRIIAAMIIFFLPIFINVVMSWLPETENFQVAACWKTARDINEYQQTASRQYNSKYDGKRVQLITQEKSNSSSTSAGNGSATGQAIVNYALQFAGNRYVYGGSWNGELPYTPTDCSGFVQGVYKHFGISLPRTTSTQLNARNVRRVSTSDIRAGDLCMYNGHVALFTGNGNEIIHAANSRSGIIITKDYRYSTNSFISVLRVDGVN